MTGELQARIDSVSWYHEFDFGHGLRARSTTDDVAFHRDLWGFIESRLDTVDFSGKSVLDIGCWDGYWSFYAERRGAARVLATDDTTQNWAGDSGIHLARELLGSSIEVDTSRSVYDLAALGRRFDIVLCLGVYYHLIDPFMAFAQIRHCCHAGTVLVLEGSATLGLRRDTCRFDERGDTRTRFLPTPTSLATLLRLAYLEVTDLTWRRPQRPMSLLRKFRIGLEAASARPRGGPSRTDRVVVLCRPFEGENACHAYRPPFGLHAYDRRWT